MDEHNQHLENLLGGCDGNDDNINFNKEGFEQHLMQMEKVFLRYDNLYNAHINLSTNYQNAMITLNDQK
jgi:hypothetical protein